jgi:hypothetical protein
MIIVHLHLDSSRNDLSADLEIRKRQVEVVRTYSYSLHLNNSYDAPRGLRDHVGSLGWRQGRPGVVVVYGRRTRR